MGKYTDEQEQEQQPTGPRKCACAANAGLMRRERTVMGHTVPAEPMCWDCWEKVKMPDWRDVMINDMMRKSHE